MTPSTTNTAHTNNRVYGSTSSAAMARRKAPDYISLERVPLRFRKLGCFEASYSVFLLSALGLKIMQLDSSKRRCLQTASGADRRNPRRRRSEAQKANQMVITGQMVLETWMHFYLLRPDIP